MKAKRDCKILVSGCGKNNLGYRPPYIVVLSLKSHATKRSLIKKNTALARYISSRAIPKINSADGTGVPVTIHDNCRIKVIRLPIKLNYVYITDLPISRDVLYLRRLSCMEQT